jgi:hypothetical protein
MPSVMALLVTGKILPLLAKDLRTTGASEGSQVSKQKPNLGVFKTLKPSKL